MSIWEKICQMCRRFTRASAAWVSASESNFLVFLLWFGSLATAGVLVLAYYLPFSTLYRSDSICLLLCAPGYLFAFNVAYGFYRVCQHFKDHLDL